MALPAAVQRQIDEANRLMAEHGQEQPPADDVSPVPDGPDSQEFPAVESPAQTDSNHEAQQPDPTMENKEWEQKYLVLQGKYNSEMRALSGQVAELAQANGVLQARIIQLEHGGTSPTRAESSGSGATAPDGANLFKPVADKLRSDGFDQAADELEKVSQQLQTQLAQITQGQAALHGTQAKTQQESFWGAIQNDVPNWQEINANPAFHQWLAESDPLSGTKRDVLLKAAGAAFDAKRAVAFFKLFQGQGTPTGQPTKPDPTKRVSPNTSGGNATTDKGGKKIWSTGEIAEFYKKVAIKRYPGTAEEIERINQDIIAAQTEGRIRISTR